MVVSLPILGGCSGQGGPLSVEEQVALLEKDLEQLFTQEADMQKPLTLYEAMARGIKYNLNHRVAMLEDMVAKGNINMAAIQALPSLDIKAGYEGRNNEEVLISQSRNVNPETQSFSVSEDSHHREASIEASWNIMDAGMAIVRTKQMSDKARMVNEQHRKVIHKIIQDVRYAYWRAASAQYLQSKIDGLFAQTRNVLTGIRASAKSEKDAKTLIQQSRLLESMHEIMVLDSRLAYAKVELASLINVPSASKFQLDISEHSWGQDHHIPSIDIPLQDLEITALMARPEMREEVLNKRVVADDIRLSVLRTFPGLGVMFGYNYDDDSFLEDDEWASFSLSLTQSLINIFTLPVRLNHAKLKERLADVKRQALAAAIMTQVHVAMIDFNKTRERFEVLRELNTVNTRMHDLASGKKGLDTVQRLEVEMQSLISQIRLHLAFADLHNAYGRVIVSVGVDPLPDNITESDINTLASAIENRFSDLNGNVIRDLMIQINSLFEDQKTDPQTDMEDADMIVSYLDNGPYKSLSLEPKTIEFKDPD